MTDSNGILLKGLDGSNPLAFLAALGTLRTLTLALPDETVRMSWEEHEGAWRPRVFGSFTSPESVLTTIVKYFGEMSSSTHPVMAWSAWTSKDAANVRSQFAAAMETGSRLATYASAIGSDAAPPTEEEGLLDNPFRAARTDYFIKNLTAIISRCNRMHLERTLFCLWDYADAMENQSLRLDASEDRRHAYQWSAPTADDSRKKRGTMLGANRLVIEAYEFFQSCMNKKTLSTVAFGPKENDRRRLRWPIWLHPCADEVVRSILALGALWEDFQSQLDSKALRARGIVTVNECTRIKVGDSNPRTNFTPSRSLF